MTQSSDQTPENARPSHAVQFQNSVMVANTRRAYAADWKHFNAWCRQQNLSPLPASAQVVGLYIIAQASGAVSVDIQASIVATIERRLSALAWNFTQRGQTLDLKNRHIANVMAGIRSSQATPPRQKDALLAEDLIAMLEHCPHDNLRGLRDRAMLLLSFAGGLRRFEITGLDVGRDQTYDSRGCVDL